MARPHLSTKRLAISRANAQMIGIVAAAVCVAIFCLIASKAVLSQNSYRSKVIAAKTTVREDLLNNIKAVDQLTQSYQQFIGQPTNVIGGSKTGTGDRDGDNAKIILDSLPSSYDFPALTSSLEKILADRGITPSSITGTDEELTQQANAASATPQAVSIPFSFSVANANYDAVKQLIDTLQLSIRPIQVDGLDVSGATTSMTVTVKAHTYYQPGKNLSITKQVVK